MPTKLRLPKFVPIVTTRVVDLTKRMTGKSRLPASITSEVIAPQPVAATPSPVVEADAKPVAVESSPAPLPQLDFDSEVTFQGGHHDEIKKSDFGFNMGLSTLERFAREQAQAHAQAGLPRMHVEAPEELPVEAMLRARASEIFVDWKTKSTRKVQDALQAAVLQAGNGVVALRHAIDQARLAQYKAGKLENELQAARR